MKIFGKSVSGKAARQASLSEPVLRQQAVERRAESRIDVADHPAVARWMRERARTDPEGFLRLAGPNRRRLEARLGKPRWRSSKDGWSAGWSLVEHGLSWIILTGKSGTIFQIRIRGLPDSYLQDPGVGLGIIRFLEEISAHLSEN